MALRGMRLGLGRRAMRLTPPALLAAFYLGLVVIGALTLWLPWSHHGTVGLWDAAFTSMSAVTVTGLAVVDTGSAFTVFGQAVIAILIQMGGLGLMTFAVFVLSAIGIPIGFSQRLILREDLNQSSIGDLATLVRMIFVVSLACEAVGAVLLALVFVPASGWGPGLWQALFHSVSAFNNAGFALWPDSLSQWVANPLINLVIPALFITGGLGFIVLGDLYTKRSWRRLSLHSKLMIVGSLALITLAWMMFAALEWRNPGTLGGLDSVWDKLQASWFQAVTPRTAGFNTINTAAMHDSTALMTMTLMLIGAGSTSTAGGIKVTTFIVLLLATVAFFRRRATLHAFGRSLGLNEVMKVLALTTVSILIVFVGLFIISISHDGSFIALAFEVASAFGTTGLSMGATPELDTLGRCVIMLVMFLGRVGPLTLGFFLAMHSVAKVRYPAGQIFLG
ncbi:TrkH family potassium uptake protein [Puniceibacterium sp. IMCC21224]|uniref:TrkH family potassium uptake protein n=1 Tax=Puniceibacterium sp. IMCC21224 TaxID=1618204 RepID=UPI00065D6A0B|nr:TrkH family potassium uptake protein [Puniceibacterium sp. IMCC21224]KMK65208.1 potassium uptake protein, TrkH family [Puniceibacterium sp. IMCC21224]